MVYENEDNYYDPDELQLIKNYKAHLPEKPKNRNFKL